MPTKKKPAKKVIRKSKPTTKKTTKKSVTKKSARPAKKTKPVKSARKPAKKATASKFSKAAPRKTVKKKSTGKKSLAPSPKPKSPVFVNPNIFREYDIRGIVADDLQVEVVELLGKAYGTYMVDKGAKVVTVGRDVRTTSLTLKNALVKGMMSTGLEVIDVGEVPTPVLYYSIVFYKTDGGIMVTGSHNPREYNGFKMCLGLAPIFGTEIQRLRHIIDGKAFAAGKGSYHEKTIISQYVQMITEKIHLDKKFKIVIDHFVFNFLLK